MFLLKVASGVVNQTPMGWGGNQANILAAMDDARNQGVSVLCLPELCITGYGCEDYFFSEDLQQQAYEVLKVVADQSEGLIVSVGLPVTHHNRLYNAACLIVNKQVIGFYCKQNLANNGIHYEARWFHAWPAGVVESLVFEQVAYPIGDFVFDIAGTGQGQRLRIGFEICEDAWVANRPGQRHYERGVDVMLNPSASHFAFGKFHTRERLVVDASRAFGCSYVYTNLLGNEAGQAIYDGDALIASNGELLVSGPRFSYADHFIITAVIDVEKTRLNQVQNRSRLPRDTFWRAGGNFDFPILTPVLPQLPEMEPFEKGGFVKEEEFARAVCLGLFDYLRKSKSQGFTVSLSGGADSCACVALAGLMIRLADESIGLKTLLSKLGHVRGIEAAVSPEAVASLLIQTVYQATENSSADTLESASELAQSIGARFLDLNINELVIGYTKLIEAGLGRPITWDTDDVALQNIQARVRAPGVWMLANIAGNLLLATSNRSEVAVGYATMDGDTAGSISPIAGIDKFWLRKWLVWLELTGCQVKGKSIRIKGLKKVNSLQPTAELRPKEKMQTDEADLMPYEFLDTLERLAIRDKKSPLECYQNVSVWFEGRYEAKDILIWVERFFRLWSRNQWKRERYAPSFHLDDYNLSSRSWCRFPILSGGFEKELRDLQNYFHGKSRVAERQGRIGF